MKDFSDKVDMFIDENRLWHFEGSTGVRNFEKLLKAIGYRESFGSVLGEFLADNPGAIEVMVEWIKDSRCEEWDENLSEQLPEEELDEAA